ncbi:DUF3396 domain-containing protein [Corallococcus sp. AS-1-12]|uniref:DUF3396 domain-containing protein n=1 Tax=Corallococcus sp. AS-1-12 TaxID=2874598 RepID=UPI001CBBDA25|nr:DUF3396 domain-containing protein [Corallococcus sp. AS-1-12]MBZ4330185.1 DUF3396 domain-containing protein [Corallococcus sp. AS-1-12]
MTNLPRVRIYIKSDFEPDFLAVNDGLQLCLFMPHAHNALKPRIQRALDLYRKAIGKDTLGFYGDLDGQWQTLDTEGWQLIYQRIHDGDVSHLQLLGAATTSDPYSESHRYKFHYVGYALDRPPEDLHWPNAVSALQLTFPTEFLEAQGPERFRALAIEIASALPFSSGQAGLSFNGEPLASVVRDEVKALSSRHPAMDVPNLDDVARDLGTRVRAPAWMNFLGPPVLQELGGVEGLRSRLHSPGTTVQALGPDRAVVTLGPWPEAGDAEQGQTLPAYRELARVLEPWLYQGSGPEDCDFFTMTRRWQRRFLD